MSHVACERVMSLIKEGLADGVDEAVRCVDGHIMSHMWMSHVSHMDESRMSHVSNEGGAQAGVQRGVKGVLKGYVALIDESCDTHG